MEESAGNVALPDAETDISGSFQDQGTKTYGAEDSLDVSSSTDRGPRPVGLSSASHFGRGLVVESEVLRYAALYT